MPSIIDNVVFREPAGRPNTFVHFAGALMFLSVYAYAWSVGQTGGSEWLLIMTAASAVAGIAESLPTSSHQVAGILRLVVIAILLCLVAATVAAPDLILG
jgi:hypothetical protein